MRASERASERTCEAANRSGGLIRKERAKEVGGDKRGHSHMTSALRGREVSPQADNSTDRLGDPDCDKGGEGVLSPQNFADIVCECPQEGNKTEKV